MRGPGNLTEEQPMGLEQVASQPLDPSGYLKKLAESNYPRLNGDFTHRKPDRTGGPVVGIGPDWEFVTFDELVNKFVLVDFNDIDPNVTQPRTVFKQTPLEETAASIAHTGLDNPPKVTLARNKKTGKLRAFLIDGERRYRALKMIGVNEVPVLVKGMLSMAEVFQTSYKDNLHREGHNDMEHARSVLRLRDHYETEHPDAGRKEVMDYLVAFTGFKEGKIRNFLRLLTLSPAIQAQIENGGIKQTTALNALRSHKRGRPIAENTKRTQELAAAILLKALADGTDVDDSTLAAIDGAPVTDNTGQPKKRLTGKEIALQRTRAILAGDDDAFAEGELARMAWDTRNMIARLPEYFALLLDPANHARLKASLRNMGTGRTPNNLLDDLRSVAPRFAEFDARVVEAINPDPLDSIPGAPTYSAYVESILGRANFTPHVQNLCRVLAQASDSKAPTTYTASQIAEKIDAPQQSLGRLLTLARASLPRHGLELDDTHIVRSRDARGKYQPEPSYRLKFNDVAKRRFKTAPEVAATPEPTKPVAVEAPVQLPAAVVGEGWDPKISELLLSADAEKLEPVPCEAVAPAEATSEVATPPQPAEGDGVFPLAPELIILQAVLKGVGQAHAEGKVIDAGVEAAITAKVLSALGPDVQVEAPKAAATATPAAVSPDSAPAPEVKAPAAELKPAAPAPAPAPEKTETSYPRVSPKKLTMLPGDRIEEGGKVAGFENTYLITPIQFIPIARAFYNKCIAAFNVKSPELNDLLTTERRLMIRLRVTHVSGGKFKLALSANVKGFEKECDALKASLLTIAHNRFPDCEEVVLEELNYPSLTTASEQVSAQAAVTPRAAPQPVAPQRATPAAVRTDTANAVARSTQPVAVPRAAVPPVASPSAPKSPSAAPPPKAVSSSQISLTPISAGNAVAALRGIAKIQGEAQWIAPVSIEKLGYIQSVRLLASYSDQKAAQSLAEYLLKILATSTERVGLNAEIAGQGTLVVRLRKRDEKGSDYVLGINVAGGGRFAQQFMTELRGVFSRSHPGKGLILEELRSAKDS